LAESAERFRDLLQDFDPQESNAQLTGLEAKLDRIGDDVRSVADSELPALRKEMSELRGLLADLQRERDS
ncbi:MAG TPA: hypothetical protein VK869_11950, partial [Rubrobacteraceae bacterium]|nr:hypothetical protein [Rubrobacteraceae bacterium]